MCIHPVSRADDLVGGSGAHGEVKLLDGETLVIETDVVCPTGCPVFYVSHVRVAVDQYVSTTVQRARQ